MSSSSSASAPAVSDTFEIRELFGGAMQCELPTRFDDTSMVREVPDNQEVYADAASDQSVIIEVVEYDASIPDDQCALFHFQEIARLNDALASSQVYETHVLTAADCPSLPADAYKAVTFGMQLAPKYREAARNQVHVYVTVIRLPQVGTDLLVTLNDPQVLDPESSSAKVGATPQRDQQAANALLTRLIATLRVNDWGLFG